MKCSACGDRAVGPGPNGTKACRSCLKLLKLKRVQWSSVAKIPGESSGGEGMDPAYWDDSKSGKEIFEDAVAEAKRLKLW